VELWVTNYNILGRQLRRELRVEVATGNDPACAIAEAILRHEFAEVDLPFGKTMNETFAMVLKRFSIVNVTYEPAAEYGLPS